MQGKMSQVQGMAAPFGADISDANAILLLVPSMDPADDEGCVHLLDGDSIENKNVLCVTLTDTPDDRMASWRVHMEDQPAKTAFIGVGDPARSAAATNGSVHDPQQAIQIESVSSPGDLTGLGMRVTQLISEWKDNENDTVLCFHTLTSLIQYVDIDRVFRFLHMLTARFDVGNTVGHFHMDPTAHDEREINTIKTLFDAVVEFRDGEWVVRSL
jgi:hypothetical protein